MSTCKILLFILISGLALMCTSKATLEDFDQSLYDCHHQGTWDEVRTEAALVGTWVWKQTVCPRTTSGKKVDNSSLWGTAISIEKNGKLIELFNGMKIKEYSWSLIKKDGDLFGLEVTPFFEIVEGRILLCESLRQVDFGNSYLDGCDYRFKKVD